MRNRTVKLVKVSVTISFYRIMRLIFVYYIFCLNVNARVKKKRKKINALYTFEIVFKTWVPFQKFTAQVSITLFKLLPIHLRTYMLLLVSITLELQLKFVPLFIRNVEHETLNRYRVILDCSFFSVMPNV